MMPETQNFRVFSGRPQQRGAAIVTALLVVALATTAATWLLQRMDRWIERVAIQRDRAQAQALSRSALALCTLVLDIDSRRSSTDSLDEEWARTLPPMRVGEHDISVQMLDLQGRFNLNNLSRQDGRIDEEGLAAYRRLLAQLALPEQLAGRLVAHLAGEPSGAAGRTLLLWGELGRVTDYTPDVLARLEAHVAVLPGRQPINVNTASAEVLAAIQPGLDLSLARALIQSRQTQAFTQLIDYRKRVDDITPLPALMPLSTASQHFLARVRIRGPRSTNRFDSLLQRQSGAAPARILWTRTH